MSDNTLEKKQPERPRRFTTNAAARRREAEAEAARMAALSVERHDGAITTKKDRPTPSRRDEEDEDEGGNFVTRAGSGLVGYWQGVRSELAKVAWPTRDEARRLTTIVLIALVAAALTLGLISVAFTELFRIGIDSPWVLFGVMILGIAAGVIFNRISNRRTTTY